MILAGDVGGTKIRLALYEHRGGRFNRAHTAQFESRDVADLGSLIRRYLEEQGALVEVGCCAVAGPVIAGVATLTNLGWTLVEQEIADHSGVRRLRLVNDLAATAAALPHLAPSDLTVLHPGEPVAPEASPVVRAVVAPGTGLGEGYLVTTDGHSIAFASEGGHADFAPNNELEDGLLRYLRARFGHVSLERVLCGPGLVNVFEYLRDERELPVSPELAEQLHCADPAAVIAANGISGGDDICRVALELFVSALGAEAGNSMLRLMALGGVYLGGGIPPKILPALTTGALVRSYLDKGRLSPIVRRTPLYLINDDHAALLGAASIGMTLFA